jgi:hypothetical protein
MITERPNEKLAPRRKKSERGIGKPRKTERKSVNKDDGQQDMTT